MRIPPTGNVKILTIETRPDNNLPSVKLDPVEIRLCKPNDDPIVIALVNKADKDIELGYESGARPDLVFDHYPDFGI